MDEVLAVTLCEALYQRLDYLDRLVSEADRRSRAALADTEIARMTAALRALLFQHQPDKKGAARSAPAGGAAALTRARCGPSPTNT